MGIFIRVLGFCLASGLLFATLGTASVSTTCCQRSSTVLHKSKVTGYHRQEAGICPVEAIVFTTVQGKTVCSDPKKPWVKKAMKYIDSNKKQTTPVTAEVPVTTEGLSNISKEPIRNATAHP